MKDKAIFGGVIGALAILLFTFAMFLILADFFQVSLLESTVGIVISAVIILLAPFAGGFLAGLLGREDPRRAGLLAGLIASLVVFIAWLAMTALTIETILSGLVIVFVWIMLARLASGFALPPDKRA
jgi:MFS family permease